MIVEYTDDQTGFGNTVADAAIIPSFTSSLSSVPQNTRGEVSVHVEFLGDFESSVDEFSIYIEGFSTGQIASVGEYVAGSRSFTIDQATWAAIIADGTININYNLGPDTQEGTYIYNVEEYIRVSFSWDYDNLVKGTRGNDTLLGTAFNDILRGRNGNDKIWGNDGDDILRSMGGNDKLWGGAGADTFVYSTHSGRDTIMDFETGLDKIDVSKWKVIEDFADLKSHARNRDGDLWIIDGNHALIIKDFTKGELVDTDFLF